MGGCHPHRLSIPSAHGRRHHRSADPADWAMKCAHFRWRGWGLGGKDCGRWSARECRCYRTERPRSPVAASRALGTRPSPTSQAPSWRTKMRTQAGRSRPSRVALACFCPPPVAPPTRGACVTPSSREMSSQRTYRRQSAGARGGGARVDGEIGRRAWHVRTSGVRDGGVRDAASDLACAFPVARLPQRAHL